MLRNESGSYFKPYVFLSIRCLISDLTWKMTSFREYRHLFFCKRGFNVLNRCQCCTRFYVDSVRLSCAIQKSLSFNKTELDPEIVKNLFSQSFYLNVHYISVVSPVNQECDIPTATNFGLLYFGVFVVPCHFIYLEI